MKIICLIFDLAYLKVMKIMGEKMGFVQIAVGVSLILLSIGGYSAQLDYYSVVNIKNKDVLNVRAWPSAKSKIMMRIVPQTREVIFLNKRKLVDKKSWMKIRWNKQEGWVNAYYLKKQTPSNNKASKPIEIKPAIKKKVAVKNKNNVKQQPIVAPITNKAVFNNRNQQPKNTADKNQNSDDKSAINDLRQQGDRYIQPTDIPASPHIKTKIGHTFSVQPRLKSRLSCRGLKPLKWKIKMNMKHKRMWVKVEDEGSYSLPITYSQWSRTNRKRMIVLAGKGRKRVKALINRNHLCRRKFSRSRYTYSINATVSQSQLLSGCCADISR